MNEYEIQRSKETEEFFEIAPEYRNEYSNKEYELGYEYTSANTKQLTEYQEISDLLDRVGKTEFYG